MPEFSRLALIVSDTEKAEAAATNFRGLFDWVPLEQAEAAVV